MNNGQWRKWDPNGIRQKAFSHFKLEISYIIKYIGKMNDICTGFVKNSYIQEQDLLLLNL